MRNAEAKVCHAAGPRWEAPLGGRGAEVGGVYLPERAKMFCMVRSTKSASRHDDFSELCYHQPR